MTGSEVLDALVALGGLGGIAATVTSLATLVKTRQVHGDTQQLQPDHGSSLADTVTRMDKTLTALGATVDGQGERMDDLAASVRGVGHQVGEMRRDAADVHKDHGDRLHRLESRPLVHVSDRRNPADHG